MNIFKRWKEYLKIEEVLDLTYKYRKIKITKPININDIYIVTDKTSDVLFFFVKKDNWKKYIGVYRDYLSDSQGNNFSHDSLCKSEELNLQNIKYCHESDFPKELIVEFKNELIKYKDDIKIVLEDKIKEEFYK